MLKQYVSPNKCACAYQLRVTEHDGARMTYTPHICLSHACILNSGADLYLPQSPTHRATPGGLARYMDHFNIDSDDEITDRRRLMVAERIHNGRITFDSPRVERRTNASRMEGSTIADPGSMGRKCKLGHRSVAGPGCTTARTAVGTSRSSRRKGGDDDRTEGVATK